MDTVIARILVWLIAIGNGVSAVQNSSLSPLSHSPQVTEILDEVVSFENTSSPSSSSSSSSASSPTSSASSATSATGSSPTSASKELDEPARSSSKNTISTSDFSPSVYLGEITESESQPRKSLPFNNVQHVRFEGSIGLEGDTGTVTYPTQAAYPTAPHYPTDHRYEEYHSPLQHPPYAEGYVTIEVPSKPVYYTEDPGDVTGELQAKPTKYEFEPILHYENYQLSKPNYYHYTHQFPVRPDVAIGKPETLLYLTSHRETQLMKTRKFPYKYYQPTDDTPIHYIEQGHAFPQRHMRISPWRKLIHLIGAFLPLGLLLAALKPPIVRIDSNTTQPSIVLSKWRGIDLPVEHRLDEDGVCEDRSLCRIILSGADDDAELVYSILWNFAIKSTDEEARQNGLDEIFNGVKKKDCNLVKC